MNQLGIADRNERIQAMESVLELPRSVGHFVRVPKQDELPPGPLATAAARPATAATRPGHAGGTCARPPKDEDDRGRGTLTTRDRVWVLTLADKLRRLFDYDFPGVHDSADVAGLGGRRAVGVRRRLQQVRHQQEPCKSRRG